jgi:hypothetical protein
MAVFWIAAPCSLVEFYQRFRGSCCLHHQGDSSLKVVTSAVAMQLRNISDAGRNCSRNCIDVMFRNSVRMWTCSLQQKSSAWNLKWCIRKAGVIIPVVRNTLHLSVCCFSLPSINYSYARRVLNKDISNCTLCEEKHELLLMTFLRRGTAAKRMWRLLLFVCTSASVGKVASTGDWRWCEDHIRKFEASCRHVFFMRMLQFLQDLAASKRSDE